MKKIKMAALLFPPGMVAAESALAYSGHDHGHWSALLIHVLWLTPVAVAAAVLFVRRRNATIAEKE